MRRENRSSFLLRPPVLFEFFGTPDHSILARIPCRAPESDQVCVLLTCAADQARVGVPPDQCGPTIRRTRACHRQGVLCATLECARALPERRRPGRQPRERALRRNPVAHKRPSTQPNTFACPCQSSHSSPHHLSLLIG